MNPRKSCRQQWPNQASTVCVGASAMFTRLPFCREATSLLFSPLRVASSDIGIVFARLPSSAACCNTRSRQAVNPPAQKVACVCVIFSHPLYRAPVGSRLAGFPEKTAACGRGPLGSLLTGGLLVRIKPTDSPSLALSRLGSVFYLHALPLLPFTLKRIIPLEEHVIWIART
jgi:hypothetical protein